MVGVEPWTSSGNVGDMGVTRNDNDKDDAGEE
jgi:hypothetical protein